LCHCTTYTTSITVHLKVILRPSQKVTTPHIGPYNMYHHPLENNLDPLWKVTTPQIHPYKMLIRTLHGKCTSKIIVKMVSNKSAITRYNCKSFGVMIGIHLWCCKSGCVVRIQLLVVFFLFNPWRFRKFNFGHNKVFFVFDI